MLGIQFAHRGAVGALDVVVVDLEFRLGVNFSAFGEQQVVARLTRIGSVGAWVDHHLAVENAAASFTDNAAEGFAARGVRCDVIGARVVVHVLPPGSQENARDVTGRAGLGQLDPQVVADQAAAEVHVAELDAGIAGQPDIHQFGVQMILSVLLQSIEREPGSCLLGRLRDRVCPAGAVLGGEMLNNAKAAVGSEVDQDARLRRAVVRDATEKDQVQRLTNLDIRSDANQRAAGRECGIDGGQRILAKLLVGLNRVDSPPGRGLIQHFHARRQGGRCRFLQALTVQENQSRRARRKLEAWQSIQCQATAILARRPGQGVELSRHDRLQVGIFPVFVLAGRVPSPGERRHGLTARCTRAVGPGQPIQAGVKGGLEFSGVHGPVEPSRSQS